MAPSLTASIVTRLGFVVDWIYPPQCRFCKAALFERANDCFCASCLGKIRAVRHPLCPKCGRPYLDAGGEDHLCGSCLSRPPEFDWARAWACYPTDDSERHPLREVLQRFKYGRKLAVGKPLGRIMARECQAFVEGCVIDIIIPVPLHTKRLRWRGFNQALILGREMGRRWLLPVDPFVLLRSQETQPQTQLAEEDRRKNVRGAFSVAPGKAIARKAVLLVDDVYTSGATVNECSRTLRRAGAEKVYVLTLGRAVS